METSFRGRTTFKAHPRRRFCFVFFFFSNFMENVCLRTQWKFASLVSTPVKVVAAAITEKDTMSWHSGQRKKKKIFEIGPGFPRNSLSL